MSSSDLSETRRLLVESAWLGKLARRLVRDPARAEDAVQETLLAFSRETRQEGDGRAARYPSRRWLASVLRNFLRQDHRARSRRSRIEAEGGSTPKIEHSAQDVAATLEIQRRLIEAVQSLEEPYRSVITMRFLESRPPREVARRMGTPVKTVHTRVERGLARLRTKLDGSYSARSEWLSVLAPLTFRYAAPMPGLSVMFMSSSMKWAGSLLGLLAIGWVLQSTLNTESNSSDIEAGASSESTLAGARESDESGAEHRVEAASRSPLVGGNDEARPVSVSAPAVFEGRVTDTEGRPVGGITVRFEPLDVRAQAVVSRPSPAPVAAGVVSDFRGVFEMALAPERGRLVGRGRGFAPVISPGVNGAMPGEPPRVVVAPERSYAGVVVDENGSSLHGVELAVVLAGDVAGRLRPGGLSGIVPVARCRSGQDGRFSFDGVGFVEGSALRAEHAFYRTRSLDLPSYSRDDLEVSLSRARPEGKAVAGHVLDREGQPVAGANVSAGQSTTITDERGAFVLDLEGRAGDILRAIAEGWQPAAVSLSGLKPSEYGSIELRLGEAGRTIRGRVINHSGEPVANAQVWTFEGEHFGFVSKRIGDVDFMLSKDVEEMIGGGGRDGRQTHTDSLGRFELVNLTDRKYGLLAMHPTTLGVGRADFVPAGAPDSIILIADAERVAAVSGRVVGYGGAPVEGALIRVSRQVPIRGGKSRYRAADRGFFVKTDATGKFRFEKLAIDGTTLLLNGEMIPSPKTLALAQVVDITKIEFRVPARCHVRVRLESDPKLAVSFELLDAEGQKLSLSFMRGGVTLGAQAVGIADGVSPLVQTDESARTLVLYGREGQEVRRHAIDLEAGKANEIRL